MESLPSNAQNITGKINSPSGSVAQEKPGFFDNLSSEDLSKAASQMNQGGGKKEAPQFIPGSQISQRQMTPYSVNVPRPPLGQGRTADQQGLLMRFLFGG